MNIGDNPYRVTHVGQVGQQIGPLQGSISAGSTIRTDPFPDPFPKGIDPLSRLLTSNELEHWKRYARALETFVSEDIQRALKIAVGL